MWFWSSLLSQVTKCFYIDGVLSQWHQADDEMFDRSYDYDTTEGNFQVTRGDGDSGYVEIDPDELEMYAEGYTSEDGEDEIDDSGEEQRAWEPFKAQIYCMHLYAVVLMKSISSKNLRLILKIHKNPRWSSQGLGKLICHLNPSRNPWISPLPTGKPATHPTCHPWRPTLQI